MVITAPDPDWLKDFSRTLVEDRLCASAHNFAPMRSVYRWRGESTSAPRDECHSTPPGIGRTAERLRLPRTPLSSQVSR